LKQKNMALENKKGSLDGKVVELQSLVSTKDLEIKELNVVAKLDADPVEMACHIEAKFYPHLLTTISGRREGRSLTDVAAYNPSVEANFNYTLQELRELDYPLLAELKSHKDASVEDIMNLLRLEGPLADAPGMGDLQPNVEQLKVPIHISKEQTPLSKPLSVQNLIGEASTSTNVPAATVTITILSTTFTSASSVPSITINDYEILHADDQECPHGND
nr:hypothetical protein [Tanacetum cinerariifolium]